MIEPAPPADDLSPLKGGDVLRELAAPAVPRDEIEELRRRRDVMQEYERASLKAIEDFGHRLVRIVVFEGCAPALLLILLLVLCLIRVLR